MRSPCCPKCPPQPRLTYVMRFTSSVSLELSGCAPSGRNRFHGTYARRWPDWPSERPASARNVPPSASPARTNSGGPDFCSSGVQVSITSQRLSVRSVGAGSGKRTNRCVSTWLSVNTPVAVQVACPSLGDWASEPSTCCPWPTVGAPNGTGRGSGSDGVPPAWRSRCLAWGYRRITAP